MSAALAVLPVVWATADVSYKAMSFERRSVPQPRLAFYRKHTEGLLRRYLRMSIEMGKAPSLLGKDMFRGRVTNYRVHGFDDVVIFVHDIEQCLATLSVDQRDVVERIALQEYTHSETAAMMGLPQTTASRWYGEALDQLTQCFLDRKLLVFLTACQEAKTEEIAAIY